MNSIFTRGHRICRSTRLRATPLAARVVSGARRHMQQQVVTTEALSESLPVEIPSELTLVPVTRPHPTEVPRPERFEAVFKYLEDGLTAQREVRKGTWMQLLQLAESPAQMERVVETFPRWRAMRKSFDKADSELFMRRCEELNCAPLALSVFSDHPKYGIQLSHLAGLQLVHALHLTQPLASTVTASALLKAAGFPGPEGDLPACAMLVSASLEALTAPKSSSAEQVDSSTEAAAISAPETETTAKMAVGPHVRLLRSLLPALKLLTSTTPASLYRPPPPGSALHFVRARFSEKPKLWLGESLARIQSQLGHPEVRALRLEKETRWVGGAVAKFAPEVTTVQKVNKIQAEKQ